MANPLTYRQLLWIPLFLLALSGCRTTDDQSAIPKEWQQYYNAAPVNEAPLQTNSLHKVLIAVLDSGVDYNHPLLKDHVHYELNEQGKAIGAGWDFLGNDPWPLPYLARTKHLYTKSDMATKTEALTAKNIKLALKLTPSIAQWIEVHRHIDDELDVASYHGTHVAGLASYDDPRIGIIPLRVLPEQESANGKPRNSVEGFYADLEAAILKAHAMGAKVVNMSLSTSFAASDNRAKAMIESFQKFEALVNKHSDMIFVAASGNDSTWVNGTTRYSFPCGIKAENMVCVASINQKGLLSEFTNIPLVSSHLVFAMGENVIGPIPSHFCPSKTIDNLTLDVKSQEIEQTANQILKDCPITDKPNMQPISGTSMAAPIVARALAQELMSLPATASTQEVINSFLSHGTKEQVGPLIINKFSLPVPSWYPKEPAMQTLGLRESSISRGYFEFYTKD